MLSNLSIGTFVASLPEGLEWLVTKVAETEKTELREDGRITLKVNKTTEIHIEKGIGYVMVCVSFIHEGVVCTFTKAVEFDEPFGVFLLNLYVRSAFLPN